MSKTVAWIGTGVMGAPMAGHLLAAGYDLRVFTRSKAKSDELVASGACWCSSPGEAAKGADFVCAIVGFPSDVKEVFLGADGVVANAKPGAVLIDFTTSSPALAVEIAEAAEKVGAHALDAPVSGGDVGAQNAALSIMVGGTAEAFELAEPLLAKMGKQVVLQGPSGSGQHTKMSNQVIIAGTMVGICEALVYARKSGLDPAKVLESIGGGAAASWGLANLYPRMLKEDYAPGFYVEHFIKDMGIALDECRRMGVRLPGLELVHGLYQQLAEMGHGRSGTQALVLALDALA